MQQRSYTTEARRWAKFPAVLLMALAIFWLLQKYFEIVPNWAAIEERTETAIGAVYVFTDLVVIPLGSLVAGILLLFLKRGAVFAGMLIPLWPLASVTVQLAERINTKFALHNQTQVVAHFRDGLMSTLELLLLWAVYVLLLHHFRKTLYWLGRSRPWRRQPARDDSGDPEPKIISRDTPPEDVEDGDVCLLMPDVTDEQAL